MRHPYSFSIAYKTGVLVAVFIIILKFSEDYVLSQYLVPLAVMIGAFAGYSIRIVDEEMGK